MKKLAILFSIIFACGIISASAQTSATAEKKDVKTTTAKGDDGAKAKGCCAYSTKSCKAGSMKCCTKDKAEKSSGQSSAKAEATMNDKREEVPAPASTK